MKSKTSDTTRIIVICSTTVGIALLLLIVAIIWDSNSRRVHRETKIVLAKKVEVDGGRRAFEQGTNLDLTKSAEWKKGWKQAKLDSESVEKEKRMTKKERVTRSVSESNASPTPDPASIAGRQWRRMTTSQKLVAAKTLEGRLRKPRITALWIIGFLDKVYSDDINLDQQTAELIALGVVFEEANK